MYPGLHNPPNSISDIVTILVTLVLIENPTKVRWIENFVKQSRAMHCFKNFCWKEEEMQN